MARTLAAPLKLAQEQVQRRPFLKVVVSDRQHGVRRLRPVLYHDGADADMAHAVASSPGANALLRLRVNGATLQLQRTVGPVDASDFATWSGTFRTNTLQCALARHPTSTQTVSAFATDTVTPTEVYQNISTDGGATWAGWTLAFTGPANVLSIAAAYKSNGDIVAVYATATTNVYARRFTAGAWGAAVSATTTEVTREVTIVYAGDFNVVYAGTKDLIARRFGDGFNQAADTWSSELVILRSTSASLTYRFPNIVQPDTFRLSFREIWSGTGAYSRFMLTQQTSTGDFGNTLWKEPQPFNYDHGLGLALAHGPGSELFLTTNDRVYRADLATASLDVTADVLACVYRESDRPAKTEVTLNNGGGTYTALPDAITKGSEVAISPGYFDATAVALSSDGPAVWIDRVDHDWTTNPPTAILRCVNLWAYLDGFTHPRAIQYAAGARTAFGILQDQFARVGFEFSGSGNSASSTALTPSIAIRAGETALSVVRRILDRLPDVIFTRAEFAFLTEPLATDATDWQVNRADDPDDHELTTRRYASGLRKHNHIRVLGGPTGIIVGESIDYEEVELHYASPFLIADRELTTATLAANRAAAVARKEQINSRVDVFGCPAHCGLELFDVVNAIDAAAQVASKRRVTAFELLYSRGTSPRYRHVLELGNA